MRLPVIIGVGGIILHSLPAESALHKGEWQDRLKAKTPFRTKVDDHLRYGSLYLAFTPDLIGIRGRHDIVDRGLLYLKSKLILDGIVSYTKKWTAVRRPDGSNFSSFPSQHTAQAFLSASMLDLEFGHNQPWLAATGYLMAGTVGWLRIHKNKHWLPDVLVGASLGMLVPRLVYRTHRYTLAPRIRKLFVFPKVGNKTMGLTLLYKPGL